MFKLFKDLTRPPEPLSPSGPRSRSRATSVTSTSGVPIPIVPEPSHRHDSLSVSGSAAAPNGDVQSPTTSTKQREVEEDVTETDPNAIRVVGVVHSLKDVTATLDYVVTLSELLSIPGTFESRRAFRRHLGFTRLFYALEHGLAWEDRPGSNDTSGDGDGSSMLTEDDWQVVEVQRIEGQRLAFEVLGWATGDREGERYFLDKFGYGSLLPILRKLSPREKGVRNTAPLPDARVLGLLLSHIFSNNYNFQSILATPEALAQVLESNEALSTKLGDIVVCWGAALPLLWSYVWGLDESKSTIARRGSRKAKGKQVPGSVEDQILAGEREGEIGSTQSNLVLLVFRTLLLACQASTANLMLIRQHQPGIVDFLFTRLYDWPSKRQFAETFATRDEWYQNIDAEELPSHPEWQAPTPQLRTVYLNLLRELLTAGVTPHQTWRLFSLVRVVPPKPVPPQSSSSSTHSGAPSSTSAPEPPDSVPASVHKQRSKALFASKAPQLKLVVPASQYEQAETLNLEILELIQRAMHHRNPGVFILRGGKGNAQGGLEIRDLDRAFPPSTKGFLFSTWIYISKLNEALTVLHLSQAGSKQPLFQIRVLENSQIGLTSTAQSESKDKEWEDVDQEEVVCSAPEALVPHFEWVHFAVGCRKGRSTQGGGGEARIFINGRRVGAVRISYPEPKPVPKEHHNHPHHIRPKAPSDHIRFSLGRPWPTDAKDESAEPVQVLSQAEDNQWLLGRSILLDEVISEDLVLLMHHLGPRYQGNFQEALGKFLTYKGATSINVYLHGLAQAASQKSGPSLPPNSALVRAIRTGPAFPEDIIMVSLSPKDEVPHAPDDMGEFVHNSAIAHPTRASDFKYGRARLVGNVFGYAPTCLDDAVACVGGGTVVLKLVEMAHNADQLTTALSVLHDMLKHSWSASEELERVHGFELLAALLRPKASMLTVPAAKTVLAMMGINMDRPLSAVVHNSAAYRAIGLDFELWSHAPHEIQTLYFHHFEVLLSKSRHKRFNLLRTFQKSNMVRKLLFAVRSGFYEPEEFPAVVETLRLMATMRWSAEEVIKPIFAYLVSALCQGSGSVYTAPTEPSPSQLPAAMILGMVSEILANRKRLLKINRALSLHRLLVIFLQSCPAKFVVVPCLEILKLCVSTAGLESFQRSFESEGGFALLARTLAPIWNDQIQQTVFDMLLGSSGVESSSLACAPVLPCVFTALDTLLQSASDASDPSRSRTLGLSRSISSLRQVPLIMETTVQDDDDEDAAEQADDGQLEKLLVQITDTYRKSQPFRRAITTRRIESMLPTVAEYAAISVSSAQPERSEAQRAALVDWLSALIEHAKPPATVLTQMKLLIEQLRMASAPPTPSDISTPARTPPAPPSSLTRSGSYFGSSFTSRMASSPTTMAPPPLRSRPSQDIVPSLSRARRPSTQSIQSIQSIDKKMPALRRVLTGESILQQEQDKNAAWRMIILSTDARRFATMTLDRKEYWHRIAEVEWPRQMALLRAENGVWADTDTPVSWRLDGSEGPLRMRNRLERTTAVRDHGTGKAARHKLRDAIPASDELMSAVSHVNEAPWEDPFALALNDAEPIAEEEPLGSPKKQPETKPPPEEREGSDDEEDSYVDLEDDSADKMRLVAKTLQPGDVVEEAHNIVRIVGVDALPGLLIIGRRNLYLIDGLVQTPDGQVIEADQAARDVLTIPSGTLVDLEPTDQRTHRWPYSDVVESNKRAFLFRDVALELYFSDKQNFLVVFRDKRQRQQVVSKLQGKMEKGDSLARSILGSIVLDVARAIDNRSAELEMLTRRWQSREISNFAYLQMLNQHANRTPNDVTQYPVFPWVLADYTSQMLDFTKASTYRDLSLPMGALTEARKAAAVERYQATEGVGEPPFHYGTHYSSSMIVAGFMIRLSPFTEISLALQGGNFDLADRLFSSIPKAWDSASSANRGDVRELIPEFFYSPAFLLNLNHHDFGRKQVSGDKVDDVVLPPWALNDPLLFVHWNREALESDYVSRHLPAWIDLTFGYKQRDPTSYNCFHPLSYRGAVNLDAITDENEKAAATAVIHNFGQTPVQIFKQPHPQRLSSGGRGSLPVGQRFGVAEHWQLLLRSIQPITDSPRRIHHINDPIAQDGKPVIQQEHRLVVPGFPLLTVQYGFADQSIRVYHQDTVFRLVHIVEGIEATHAAFVTPTLLATVSPLGVITCWRVTVKGAGLRRGDVAFQREATLRGHDGPVTCIATSNAWSLLVTGSEDGSVMMWDMNQLRYTRTLSTGRHEAIKFATVNEADGHIAMASDRYLFLFSLNGYPIASTSVDGGRFPEITFEDNPVPLGQRKFTGGISFLKREFLRHGNCFVIGVDSEIALYRCAPGMRRFEDQDVEPWRLVKQGVLYRSDDHVGGDVTALKFVGETLYAAFDNDPGSIKHPVYQWSLPDTNQRHVPESLSHTCMWPGCGRQFGLLEPRRHCGGCGGVFCGSHALHVEHFQSRYCLPCREQLADGSALGLLTSRAISQAGSRQASRQVSRRPSVSGQGSTSMSRDTSRSRTTSLSQTPNRSETPSRTATPTRAQSPVATFRAVKSPTEGRHSPAQAPSIRSVESGTKLNNSVVENAARD